MGPNRENITFDELIEEQRRLSASKKPFEQVVGSLLIGAILKKQLVGLPNSTISQLRTDYIWSDLNLLGPESLIVEVATERAPRISNCDYSERVKSGMRRAKLKGRQVGRARLDINREQVVVIDRRSGMSLTQVAKRHNISRASVCRLMKGANSDCSLAIAIPSGEARLEARL